MTPASCGGEALDHHNDGLTGNVSTHHFVRQKAAWPVRTARRTVLSPARQGPTLCPELARPVRLPPARAVRPEDYCCANPYFSRSAWARA